MKRASWASGGGGDGGVAAVDGSATPATIAVGVVSSLDEIVTAIQTLAKQHANEAGKSEGDDKNGKRGRQRRQQQEQGLLEASCLVMITERFPAGFLDDEAIAALLVAADALDAVLTRRLSSLDGGGGGGSSSSSSSSSSSQGGAEIYGCDAAVAATDGACLPAVGRRAALVGAVAALRGLALRLGRAMPPESPLLGRLPHADALLRVIGPSGGGVRGCGRSLLRASARLLPFLAERCVTSGDTKTALKAVVGLGLIPRVVGNGGQAAEDAGEKRRRRRGHPPPARPLASSSLHREGEQGDGGEESSRRLLLLHGVLSGFVAGESRRLARDAADAADAAAAAATVTATATATAMELDSDSDYDHAGLGGAMEDGPWKTQQGHPRPSAALDQRLVATVSHLVGCLPAPPAPGQASAAPTEALPPSLLLVWSDALRLSFLGADAQRLVFADRKPGGTVRSRSRWVEDCIAYVAERAEAAASTAGGVACRGGRKTAASTPSQRSACCHLIRAVCGCSHLLDPPLARRSVRRLVEAFVAITGEIGGGDAVEERDNSGGGEYVNACGVAQRRQRAEEDLLLHTAFCLLVQHSSEVQLDEIVMTLLEILGAEKGAALKSTPPRSPRSLADQSTAVTFMRLATRAGRGAAFKAVVPRHALSLATALCRQLRGAANRGNDLGNRPRNTVSLRDRGGDDSGRDDCGRLRNATGALKALEGLLDRQPYSSITARGVSVILGSVEPAVRAALDAMACVVDGSRRRSTSTSGGGGGGSGGEDSFVVGESRRCFRACCRVLGTVLQHYARKVYSCTPPFASLCRSLLRLFFRLASAPALATIGFEIGAPAAAPPLEPASGRFALSVEHQVAAASVFARVLEQFVPHKEVLKKYAPFLLLEYVSLSGLTALEPAPKAALLSGIFAVMQACSRREMRQLHGLLGTLPTGTGQEVFRSLNEEYQREHKYMGKM